MATIINGDITVLAKKGIIIQQVNCQNAMGAGLALTIMKKWKQVKPEYHQFCQTKKNPSELLGHIQKIELNDSLVLYNSFTQLYYGNSFKTGKIYTNESLLIDNICKTCKENPTKTIYIPYRIGCGLAGGNWKKIYTAINHLPNLIIVKFD